MDGINKYLLIHVLFMYCSKEGEGNNESHPKSLSVAGSMLLLRQKDSRKERNPNDAS